MIASLERRFDVSEAHVGERIDVALAQLLDVSRSAAAHLLDAGRVLVGGQSARRSRTLAAGDVIEVLPDLVTEPVEAPAMPPVRFRDQHLLVLAKPPGLVVHPGSGHEGDTLVDALRAAGVPLAEGDDPQRPGIVHRLDRDTSGLMLIAMSDEAMAVLPGMLSRREVARHYLALLAGVPTEPRGVVDAPLSRHPTRRTRFAVVEGGRPARTRYRVLATADVAMGTEGASRPVASVVCALETGRTHQIRVHLDAIGAPVAGDPVYGVDRVLAGAIGLDRPALHAARLEFDHPVTGQPLTFTEPLPDDLRTAYVTAGLPLPDGAELT
jgi:23S rRNA pseudouridine1911/1915/1917 synthase